MAIGFSTPSLKTCLESRADNSNLFPKINCDPETVTRDQFCELRAQAFACLGVPHRIRSFGRDAQGRFVEVEYPRTATLPEDHREWGTKADRDRLKKKVDDAALNFNIADLTSTGHLPSTGFIVGRTASKIVEAMITADYYRLANLGASIGEPIVIRYSVQSMEIIHEHGFTHLPERMVLSEPDEEKREATKKYIRQFFDNKIINSLEQAQESYKGPFGTPWTPPAELDKAYFEKWRFCINEIYKERMRILLEMMCKDVICHIVLNYI